MEDFQKCSGASNADEAIQKGKYLIKPLKMLEHKKPSCVEIFVPGVDDQ